MLPSTNCDAGLCHVPAVIGEDAVAEAHAGMMNPDPIRSVAWTLAARAVPGRCVDNVYGSWPQQHRLSVKLV